MSQWKNLQERIKYMSYGSLRNILITSAGRRVSLVRNAQETLKHYNARGKVLTCDYNPILSSACHRSDGCFRVPQVRDPNYVSMVLELCQKENISIVIPTIDTELSILADSKEMFSRAGIHLAVSSKAICDTFYLKDSTQRFFESQGVSVPKMIKKIAGASYPLFAKRNDSSCSIGAQRVEDCIQAKALLREDSRYVFQECILGDEYTCDLFLDSFGKAISVVPRQRLEVRSGEVSKAWARKDCQIIEAVLDLSLALQGGYGAITVQLFKRDDTIFFIEINPRFGGGYPLSWKAGADFMEYLIRDYLGESLVYTDDWKDNALMLRYDSEVIVDQYQG
jgi:carbamoyl-phosphate synthase large subunit